MALEWSDLYENEEELKKLGSVDLRSLYRNAPQDKKEKIAKIASERLITLDDGETTFGRLAELKIVTDYNESI